MLTLDSIPVWIRWLQYASLFRYSIEALVVNEVDGLYFNQTMYASSLLFHSLPVSPSLYLRFLYCIVSLLIFLSSNGSSILVPGTEILTSQGYKTEWLWYDQIGLGGLALLFLTLTYITLRLIKKEK